MKPFKELTIAEAEDAWNNATANHANLQQSMSRVMDLLDERVRDGYSEVNIVKVWLAIVGDKPGNKEYVRFLTGYSEEEINKLEESNDRS